MLLAKDVGKSPQKVHESLERGCNSKNKTDKNLVTEQHEDSGQRPRPLGQPELAEDEVDGGREEGSGQGRQEPQGGHGHVLSVLDADLFEVKLA